MTTQIKGFYFNILIGFLFLTGAGCISVQRYGGTYDSLIGSWKIKDQGLGQMVLTFRKDGVYELDFDGNGEKDVWGSYRLSRDWIFLNDVGGDFMFDCGQDGAYSYKINKDIMTFTLLADQCPARLEAMNVDWQWIPKEIKPEIKIKI